MNDYYSPSETNDCIEDICMLKKGRSGTISDHLISNQKVFHVKFVLVLNNNIFSYCLQIDKNSNLSLFIFL